MLTCCPDYSGYCGACEVADVWEELADLYADNGMMDEGEVTMGWLGYSSLVFKPGNLRKRLGNEYSEVKNYEKALYYFDIAEITIARRLQTRAAAAMQGKVLPAPRAAG